jgi:SPP1 gp7 family putative phage head morphogenesis protein
MIDFNDPTGREFLTLIERLKYERFIASELDDILTRAFNQIVDVIVSGKYRTLTAFQQQRLAQLFRTLATRIAETYDEVAAFQLGEMKAYATLEAVLDSRTTAICRALSGRVFRYDDPRRKVPPQHIGCRSTVRSLLKGIEEPMDDQRTPRTLKNYETWLRGQPIPSQNDILGPSRASLWRSGSMSLADAIDADNRVLTLKQLRARLGLATVGAA